MPEKLINNFLDIIINKVIILMIYYVKTKNNII